jgi:hypothetical protein
MLLCDRQPADCCGRAAASAVDEDALAGDEPGALGGEDDDPRPPSAKRTPPPSGRAKAIEASFGVSVGCLRTRHSEDKRTDRVTAPAF